MKDSYNWGILGPGKIAYRFVDDLQILPKANLYAVASRNHQKAPNFADQYQIPNSYGSYRQLVEDPEVDIVYIATPHAFHMEQSLLCLENGKAVLCEKPLAINSQQVKRMVTSAQEHQCFLMEALWSRFLPHIIKAWELSKSGTIGNILGLEADFGFRALYDPHTRLFDPHLGGGALLDIGIYPLFLAKLLLGTPQEVRAQVTPAPTGVDMEASVDLQFANQSYAKLDYTFAENTPVEARIIGDHGYILLQNRWYQPGNLIVHKHGKDQEVAVELVGNGYNYQAQEVMDCLDKNLIESPRWSHAHSWELMQLMDEIRRQGAVVYPMD